ncbi:MAG: tetratricopeptide repeat protein [Bacteroidales bacterium]|nr:tetratricopeptide repeat protein [Bacteroidales bacterium]
MTKTDYNIKKAFLYYIFLILLLPFNSVSATLDPNTDRQGIDSLLKILPFTKSKERIDILFELSNHYLSLSLDSSLEYAKLALALAKKNDDKTLIAEAYKLIGNICYYKGNYNNVIAQYDSSLMVYTEINDSSGISKALNNLGLIYQDIGAYNKSIEFQLKSLDMKIKMKDSVGIANSYNNIGAIYYELNNFIKSYEYFKKALSISQKSNIIKTTASIFNNIGLIKQEQGNYEGSIEYFNQSISYKEKINDLRGISNTHHNIGKSYFKLGNYTKALDFYFLAIDSYEKLGIENSRTLNNIGQLYIELDYYKQSLKYLKKALEIAKKNNHFYDLKDIFKNLSVSYDLMGMYKQAYNHYSLYHLYDDSLKSQIYSNKLEKIQSRHEIEKKQKEIEKINLESQLALEQKENDIRRRDYIIYSFILGMIVFLVFTLILLKLFRQNEKSNILLKKQNEEILEADELIKTKNKALKENEERFRLLVQEIPVMIDAFDNNGFIIFWNKECERITGYKSEEVLNNPKAIEMLYPNKKYRESFLNESKKTGFTYRDYETKVKCKDGSERIILWSSVSSNSPIQGWRDWAVGIDDTERRRSEHIIQESEEMLRGIFDSSPYAILVIDLKFNVIDSNPASLEMFRIKNKGVAKNINIKEFIVPEQHDVVLKNLEKAFENGNAKNNSYLFKRYDGTTFNGETSGRIIKDSSGKPVAYVVILIDITERISFIEKLKQAKTEAEESDKLKTAFLANMSHEIRTPMNSIVGFSNLLTGSGIGQEKRVEYLNHIIQSSSTLLNLIDDMIDISKIEAGQLKINIEECKLNKVINQLFLSFNDSIVNDDVGLRLNLPADTDSLLIKTDPLRIRQVLSNLIGNALKFTEKGYIEVGYIINSRKKRPTIDFYVKDTGIGIPKGKQDLIFDRFRQVDDSILKIAGGTGLGLAISKRLVELLGGAIWVESEMGKGSVFYFALPYKPIDKPTVDKSFKASRYDWKDKTILIAEDENSNFELLKVSIIRTKVKIIRAMNGEEAVEITKENSSVDLILMDIRMPKMNGYEATRKIKSFRKDLPIISITAYAMSEDESKSLEAGCDMYISKPISPGNLLALLDDFFKEEITAEV